MLSKIHVAYPIRGYSSFHISCLSICKQVKQFYFRGSKHELTWHLNCYSSYLTQQKEVWRADCPSHVVLENNDMEVCRLFHQIMGFNFLSQPHSCDVFDLTSFQFEIYIWKSSYFNIHKSSINYADFSDWRMWWAIWMVVVSSHGCA